MIQIYHNPRCGKSREALAIIEQSGQEYEVIKYLADVPTFEELQNLIEKLQIRPMELIRQKEKVWVEQFKNKTLTDSELIYAMISNPILIERPIVVNGTKAVIARPIEKMIPLI